MHTWSGICRGVEIGPHELDLGREANERYWRSAGLDAPILAAGAAYPMIAANCTVLAWLASCNEPMIQTRQHLVCHGRLATPARLATTGVVADRFERRGRDYVTVRVDITDSDGNLIWTSEVDFTPAKTITTSARSDASADTAAARLGRDEVTDGVIDGANDVGAAVVERRTLTITDDLIRRYSRRGNYHSEAQTASNLGLPGLVAQGTQVCGPAYATLLDAWGERFVERGSFDARFVAMVLGGDTVEAAVIVRDTEATFTVHNRTRGKVAATGRAACGA